MSKITEKLLLEKGSPQTNKLEKIQTLNLSGLLLQFQDLPVPLLSCLRSLRHLDLSRNRLQQWPKNLELPALLSLDLSDNQMEDVTTLGCLSGLEELKMEDNLYITVSDNHKLMVLLPNLRIYNSKDISTAANHLRYVYSENLRTRITAVFEKSFILPDPITAEKMSDLETNFLNAARQQVKYGPSSVSDFTRWRVEIIAKEYLRSLLDPRDQTEDKESAENKEEVKTSEIKRKPAVLVMDADVNLTPRKKLCSDFPNSVMEDSPRKSSLRLKPQMVNQMKNTIRMSPRKRASTTPTKGKAPPPTIPTKGQRAQSSTTPTKGQRAQSSTTPTKGKRAQSSTSPIRQANAEKPGSRGSRTCQTKENVAKARPNEAATEQQRNTDTLLTIGSETKPVILQPLHVLQCHSKQNSPEDLSTQLWACAFQPLPDSTGSRAGSRLVATCGGDSVCVIDCEAGMVMKKYKVPGEEFFSLAWSTVLMSRGSGASAQHCSIVAAGGRRGLVKLIHPRNNVAYGEFRASRKALSVLRFNQQQQNFLYTGSYDNRIIMWDIGGVDSHYNFKVIQLLMLELSAAPLHICLSPTSPKTQLLTACEDGLHHFNTELGSRNATRRMKEMEITFPVYKKEDKDHDYHTIDGLSFLTDDIVASKNYMHSSIYLWSWSRTEAQRLDKKSRAVCAVVLAELQWANTEIPYLALNTCPGRAYIVCGDDKGRLWTYHVTNLQKHNFQAGKPIVPTEVLAWPGPVRQGHGSVDGPSINSVAMDPELRYLVALSDKNMVIVWGRDESC